MAIARLCLVALVVCATSSAERPRQLPLSRLLSTDGMDGYRPTRSYDTQHSTLSSTNEPNGRMSVTKVSSRSEKQQRGKGREPSETYRAAVVEFKVNSSFLIDPGVAQATERMMSNVRGFETILKVAKQEGVQIIVFPEDGIIGGGFLSREQLFQFLEEIPDVPGSKAINPCVDASFENQPVLKKLSCLARGYQIVIVANMGDKQSCHATANHTCPPNGWYQFNTNVAFEKDGTLVAKYHKKHLFGSEKLLFDASHSTGCVSFTTSFGVTFGTFTCYDMLYPDPANCLLRKGIQHYIFPTAWGSVYPYYMSIAVQQSWSQKHKVNVLAANQHYPHPIFDFYLTGSGLYSSGVAVDYYVSGEEFELASGQMTVAELPVDPSKLHSHTQTGNRSDIGNVGASKDAYSRFVILQKLKDVINVSYQSTKLGRELQCSLEYEIDISSKGETYAIGAFIGSSIKDSTFTYAVCTLCKCPTSSIESCGERVNDLEASTIFKLVQISGSFSKGSEVLVNLLGSGLKLIDLSLVEDKGEGAYVVRGLNQPLLAFNLWSGIYSSSN